MMDSGKYRKDEFNPTFGHTLQSNGNITKKNFEPFRIKYETQKYQYVVDWQIDEDEVTAEKQDFNPYGWKQNV
jgi:hypothetical protein